MTEKLFYLTFFLLPAYLIKIPLGDFGSINVLDLLLLACIAVEIPKLNPHLYDELKRNGFNLFLLFVVMLSFFVSFLLSTTPDSWLDGLGILKSFLVLPILFGIVCSLLIKKGVLVFEKILWSLFMSIGIQAIFGYFFVVNDCLTFDNRLSFVYESPNFFAALLSTGLLLGIYLFRIILKNSKDLRYPSLLKSTVIVLLLAIIFSLSMTSSAGAWLGLACALLFWIISFVFPKKAKWIPTLLISTSFVFLLLILNLSDLLEGFNYSPRTPPTSLDSRIAIYLSGVKILSSNWLFGIGVGNFQNTYLEYQKYFSLYPQWAVPHAHNALLHIWLTGGFFAFISFFALQAKTFLPSKTKITALAMIPSVVLIYFITHGMFDVPFWKNDLAVIFWFFLIFSIFRNKKAWKFSRG